jgi:hypothetical protein
MQELSVLWGLLAISGCFMVASLVAVIVAARQRRVVCPETGRPVDVRCDGRRAVLAMFNDSCDRVIDCERWPARKGCDRACERQLGPTPASAD